MSNRSKMALLDLIGLMFCIVPPGAVTVMYFPLWKETVGIPAVAGGSVAMLAVISFIVLGRYIKVRLSTPSPVIVFGTLYLLFVLIEQVVVGLKTVMFWGFIGSAIGALMFLWSNRYKEK